MSFMLFIGPIIGVAVAIIAAVVIISVVAAAVAQNDINDEDSQKVPAVSIVPETLETAGTYFLLLIAFLIFLWLYFSFCYLNNLI